MNLSKFFAENKKCAIAFSGGVDSAYLMYAGIKSGAHICAYYVKSAFQPQFELDDAEKLAAELGAELKIIRLDILKNEKIVSNPQNRCYYCKKAIFDAIKNAALADGFTTLLDGTNASDEEGDRPGMRALRELDVRSPLRECGLTKDKIRELSREAGLFTWNKPAYACLATRIKTGEPITAQKLTACESAENCLFSLGFNDFRVRTDSGTAKIQLKEEQFSLLIEKRAEILTELKKYYSTVTLDLEVRK